MKIFFGTIIGTALVTMVVALYCACIVASNSDDCDISKYGG